LPPIQIDHSWNRRIKSRSEETGREQLKRRVYVNLTKLFSRSGQWKRNSAIIAVILTIITINVLLLFNSGETSASVDIAFPQPNGQDTTSPPHNYTKEVYATLLSPGHPHPWTEGRTDYYFEAVKVIAHRILRNTTTRDPFNRPFVVLVTESVPRKQRSILESHGCLVRQVTTLDPPVGTVNLENITPRYRDQFTKMHIWNMTEYDRIAYFDGDTLPIQPFHTIFDTPTQWKDDEE
jgi:alpha-N-acetylglucosamine transferase